MPNEPRRRGFLRDTEGAALIEAALILPILLLLVFALADLSLYLWRSNLAGKAAQLGIRAAIVSDAVAAGPGLDQEASGAYWNGLVPGARCFSAGPGPGPCPTFRVRCDVRQACVCEAGRCGFSIAVARLRPILAAMRAVLPELAPENLEITYATNGLGYVGRPPPVPVDVTLRIVGFDHAPLFVGALFGAALPLTASATLPSESLVTR